MAKFKEFYEFEEELYERFYEDYVGYLSKYFSKKYKGMSIEDIEGIVSKNYNYYIENMYVKESSISREKSLQRALDYYYDKIFYRDVYEAKKALEQEYGRDITDEEVEDLAEQLSYSIEMDPKSIFETHSELYRIYLDEMYDWLKSILEEVKSDAEEDIARTLIDEYLSKEEKEILDELGILESRKSILELAEAILDGEVDRYFLELKDELTEDLKEAEEKLEKAKDDERKAEDLLYIARNDQNYYKKRIQKLKQALKKVENLSRNLPNNEPSP